MIVQLHSFEENLSTLLKLQKSDYTFYTTIFKNAYIVDIQKPNVIEFLVENGFSTNVENIQTVKDLTNAIKLKYESGYATSKTKQEYNKPITFYQKGDILICLVVDVLYLDYLETLFV